MSGVETREVGTAEADVRLDRWFKRHYPDVTFGRLAKLLRTGQVRVDGKRAKPGQRLVAGQQVRVPPLANDIAARPKLQRQSVALDEVEAQALRERVLYRDDDLIAFDKPAGLAVQGGSGTRRHLDGMLDALRFDADERPRLVHRLDKDTSGVLVLARSAGAAAALAELFRGRDVEKTYWALVVGVPEERRGQIALALAKRPAPGGEKMAVAEEGGLSAVTDYFVGEAIGTRLSWLVLRPRTGRTHQLRAHCAALGTPIVGDGKYGGAAAFVDGIAQRLHLHARQLRFRHPATGKMLRIVAPMDGHMAESWRFLGLDADADSDDPG
ncbi:MAG: RluA family pseudouridine synthase [Alphaproteobacteria bacterium]|jgi:23S rRNA pseudouridine955/2504/2580 synthase